MKTQLLTQLIRPEQPFLLPVLEFFWTTVLTLPCVGLLPTDQALKSLEFREHRSESNNTL